MTVSENEVIQEQKQDPKELNFRKQEQMYQKMLAEREERIKSLEQLAQRQTMQEEEEYDEPYVDHKKLKKALSQFGEQSHKQTQSEIQLAVQKALHEERKQNWIKQNSDFYEVLQHAEKLAQRDPELAETILQMPEGFERQKLVYQNIKALNLHKPQPTAPSIQDVINEKKRGSYYHPSGVSPAPYAPQGDFSPSGQKNSYDKMKSLIGNLRLG